MTNDDRKTYTFNRRTVEDQYIYVEASSLEEAWRKARDSDVEQTSDPQTVKMTLRRLPETPERKVHDQQ